MNENQPTNDRRVVSQVAWLEKVGDDEIRLLLATGRLADVDPGRVLTTQSTAGREAFLLLNGEARVTVDGYVVGHLGAGDFFGEMALLDHGPRTATVTAETPIRVLAFDPAGFATVMGIRPVAREVERQLTHRLRRALARS